MPLEIGVDALKQAGYPLALIQSMQKVAREMGNAIISARMGNPPRVDIQPQAGKVLSVATKPMSIKTKTTSYAGPLKGLIPENQCLFGRAESVQTLPDAEFVSCPVSLGQMLSHIEKKELDPEIKVKKIVNDDGDSIFRLSFKAVSRKNKPKKLGEYKEEHGKQVLSFPRHARISGSKITKFRYVVDVTQNSIPCRATSHEIEAEKCPWNKTPIHAEPRWWKPEEYGDFQSLLQKQVPLHVKYQKGKITYTEEAKVLANHEGAIITGDCDLFAVSISHAFLARLSPELQKSITTPLNLSREEDCQTMLTALNELKINLLQMKIENSGEEEKALHEELDMLLSKDLRSLNAEVRLAGSWKAYFGNITGIITPYELEFNLRVNQEFRDNHQLDHIGQFLHHGPENRNPGKPSPMQGEPMLHIAGNKVFETHDEAELTSLIQALNDDKHNPYFTHVHEGWQFENGWGEIVQSQLESPFGTLILEKTRQSHESFISPSPTLSGETSRSRRTPLSWLFSKKSRTPSPSSGSRTPSPKTDTDTPSPVGTTPTRSISSPFHASVAHRAHELLNSESMKRNISVPAMITEAPEDALRMTPSPPASPTRPKAGQSTCRKSTSNSSLLLSAASAFHYAQAQDQEEPDFIFKSLVATSTV